MKTFTLNLVPASPTRIDEALQLTRRFQSLKTNKLNAGVCYFMESHNIRSLELTELVMHKNAFSKLFTQVENLENLVIDKVTLADDGDVEQRKTRLNHLKSISMTQVQGDVFSFIETTALKTYTEVIHDSSPLAPIVEMLMTQPSLEVLKLNGGKVNECFDSDRFLNAPFKLRRFTIIGGDLNQSCEDVKRFLIQQTSLKELIIQCKVQGSLLTFVLQNMRGLETLQMPTDFDDLAQLIRDVKPLPSVKRLNIVTGLKSSDLARRYFELFPSLKAVDMQSLPRHSGTQSAGVFIELNETHTGLEELHLPDIYFATRGMLRFTNLKELHVGKICFLNFVDSPFNEFIEDHSETLEKLSMGFIHDESFSRGTTVNTIRTCKKLKQISIKSDSPMATRMLKKVSIDHHWQLVTKFPKSQAENESIEIKFNFPDDESLWRDKCSVWDEDLVREFESVKNYGLNSFINMFK